MNKVNRSAQHAPVLLLLFMACGVAVSYADNAGERSHRADLPNQKNAIKRSWPGVGCWFLKEQDFRPDGFKAFIDLHASHSRYSLLTTSIRHNVEITQAEVHDQIKRAAEYARKHGMGLIMDLDVRLARQAFIDKYPDEMQEIVRLREVKLEPNGTILEIPSITLGDHYTPVNWGVRAYETISARLLRVFSYVPSPDGVRPESVRDITQACRVDRADTKSIVVSIPAEQLAEGRTACVMAAFTLFTPDVFAPHLIEFERAVLKQYADVPLSGAAKDEWGFPGRFSPRLDDFYYSKGMAKAYERRRPGRPLERDLFLMFKPHKGMASRRAAAINHYMEMNWQRNAEVENAFYKAVKQVFGREAAPATHPTWFPDPATAEEAFKNGLDWWGVRRDLAQTDETTPFCVRTALSKKWRSPIWMNMYYAKDPKHYHEDLWRHVLGGGRMNFHPIWPPPPDAPEDYLTTSLLRDDLLAADCRVRLLNFISTAPVDCPVAVVFGHPSALNWAGPGFKDVGMSIINELWKLGHYTDLIPSSEVRAGSLTLDRDGYVQYGPQRYAAVVLYHPEYETREVARFFTRAAAKGKTKLLRVGDWNMDFKGRAAETDWLPASLRPVDGNSAVSEVIATLRENGIAPQTLSARSQVHFTPSMMPEPSGQCRLLDGTVIVASGRTNVMGDPINKTLAVGGHEVRFDAIGIAAVRIGRSGRVEAMAAGGLKSFMSGDFRLELAQRPDVALWRDEHGKFAGVLQGHSGPIPDEMLRLTTNWTRLSFPEPLR